MRSADWKTNLTQELPERRSQPRRYPDEK